MEKSTSSRVVPPLSLLAVLALSALLLAPARVPGEETGTMEKDCLSSADPLASSRVLATVDSSPITSDEIQSRLAVRLRQLEHQRYELIEKEVKRVIDERLLELEAETRGLDRAGLEALEIDGRLRPVGDAQIAAFYRDNEGRDPEIREKSQESIRHYLLHQQKLKLRADLITRLRAQYRVEDHLGPFEASFREASEAPAESTSG